MGKRYPHPALRATFSRKREKGKLAAVPAEHSHMRFPLPQGTACGEGPPNGRGWGSATIPHPALRATLPRFRAGGRGFRPHSPKSARRRFLIQRTVPVAERMTTVSVVTCAWLEPHAAQQRSVGDAGRREHHVARGHLVERELLVEVGDAHLARPRLLLLARGARAGLASARRCSARRPPPARPPARRRCPDRCRCRFHPGRAVWMTPATSPSVMSRIDAPVSRTAGNQLRMARPVEDAGGDSRGGTPLALASRVMFSAGGRSRSTVPSG